MAAVAIVLTAANPFARNGERIKFQRTRYQHGCLELKSRKHQSAVWVFRYREKQPDGTKKG